MHARPHASPSDAARRRRRAHRSRRELAREPDAAQRDAADGGVARAGQRRLLAARRASASIPTSTCPRPARGGVPVYYASAFVRDGHAHGVLVGTREGRPIKIEGNPLHPSSLGATDVFAQASILELWDPDRAQRSGSGSSGPTRRRRGRRRAASTWARVRAAAGDASRARRCCARRRRAPARADARRFTSPTPARAAATRCCSASPTRAGIVTIAARAARARAGARLAFGRPSADWLLALRSRPLRRSRSTPIRSATARAACAHARDWAEQRAAPAAAPRRRARRWRSRSTPGPVRRARRRAHRAGAGGDRGDCSARIAAQLYARPAARPRRRRADAANARASSARRRAAAARRRRRLVVAGASLSARTPRPRRTC